MRIGSFEWGIATGGVLGEAGRAASMEQLGRAAERFAAPSTAVRELSFDDIVIPDSALARDAIALCRDVSEEWLVGHCLRSYCVAAALGAQDAVIFDAELLYVAAVLHDLGITSRFEGTTADECFAVVGARAAGDFSRERTSEDRARTIADAISKHLNVYVELDDGPEAHLLSGAVTIEVSGLGADALPRPFVRDLLARFPRGSTGAEVAEVIRRQARLRPDTRSAFLAEIGIAERALENPLDADDYE